MTYSNEAIVITHPQVRSSARPSGGRRFGASYSRRMLASLLAAVLSLLSLPLLVGGAGQAWASSPSPLLPFDQVSMAGSTKLVFAHYFTPYPTSIGNTTPKSLGGTGDYYDNHYLYPYATGADPSASVAYGGLLRDRPLGRAALSTPDYYSADIAREIVQAKSAGIDGFTLDILGDPYSSPLWSIQNLTKVLTQADAANFKIVLMPDMTSGPGKMTPATLASMIAKMAAHTSVMRLADKRLVLSPFYSEGWIPTQWSSLFSELGKITDPVTGKGFAVAFVPCFNNISLASSYVSLPQTYGLSNWGNRSPGANTLSNLSSLASSAHAQGKIWMQPVSVQDERPNQSKYYEAKNTSNLRATWDGAISGGADWVQIPTWNDYSEGAQVAPSVEHGWTYLDLVSYYAQWFKSGSAPAIIRDAVYLTHRTQSYAVSSFTSGQTARQVPAAGSDAPVDQVEALSFLTAPATVKLTVGGVSVLCQAPAGVHVCTSALHAGRAAASVWRTGSLAASVATRQTITSSPAVQDLQYVAAGSLRDGPADSALIGADPSTPTSPAPTSPAPTSPATPPTPTATPTVATAPARVVLAPVADVFTNSSAPTSNYGANTSITARGGISPCITYIRFDLPAAAQGAALVGATLSLTTDGDSTNAPTVDQYDVTAGQGTIDELGATWNNPPKLTGSAKVATLGPVSTSNTVVHIPLDMASLASLLPLSGTSSLNLMISGSGSDSVRFWSREWSNASQRPVLELTYANDTSAPSQPVISATTTGYSTSLSWSASSDDTLVRQYRLYRSASSGTAATAGILIGQTSGLSYTNSGLAPGSYCYQVQAADGAGNVSVASAEVCSIVVDETPPSSCTLSVIPASTTSGRPTLSWTPSTDDIKVTGYRIFRSPSSGLTASAMMQVASMTTTTWTDPLKADGTYYYKVVAVDSSGNLSTPSNEVSTRISIPFILNGAAVNDTWVNSSAPTANYYLSPTLSVDGSPSQMSLMRFTVPAAPAGKTLVSATLSLRTADTSGSGSQGSFAIKTAADTWSSPSVNWNIRPAVGSSQLGSLISPAKRSTAYSVTLAAASLYAARSATGSITLVLTTTSSDQLSLVSSDSSLGKSAGPTLVLTYQ